MESQRFWVIGGEYRSFDFDHMIEGTEQVVGPLASRDQAEEKWKEMSQKHKREATVRFTIAAER